MLTFQIAEIGLRIKDSLISTSCILSNNNSGHHWPRARVVSKGLFTRWVMLLTRREGGRERGGYLDLLRYYINRVEGYARAVVPNHRAAAH